MGAAPPRVLALTDEGVSDAAVVGLATAIVRAAPGDALATVGLLVRDAGRRSPEALAALAARAAEGLWLGVKGGADDARALGAAVAHLGAAPPPRLGPPPRGLGWSVSVRDDAALDAAARLRPAVVLVSPVGEVPGKGPARGFGAVVAARAALPEARLFALGGLGPADAAAALAAGADGLAAIRAVFGAPAPSEAARAFAEAVRTAALAPSPPRC